MTAVLRSILLMKSVLFVLCNYQKQTKKIEFVKYPRKKTGYRILRIFLHPNKY